MSKSKNKKIKKANIEIAYTQDHIRELKRCKSDPIYFAKKYVKIQHPTKGAIPFNMYDYQCDMINSYRTYGYCVTLASRQVGKEQPHSSKIATPNGWTTMGDIDVGDIVLTPFGKTSSVTHKHPQGCKSVYKLFFDDGSSAECGIDHLWNVRVDDSDLTLTLKEIKELLNDKEVSIPTVQSVEFNSKQLPITPYLLGCLITDNFFVHRKQLIYTNHNKDHLQSVSSILKYNDINSRKRNKCALSVNYSDTIKLYSHEKTIPEEYLTSSPAQRISLLQGLLDSNGKINNCGNNTIVSFSTSSKQLSKDVQQLVWSLGGQCKEVNRIEHLYDHDKLYHLCISMPNIKKYFTTAVNQNKCKNSNEMLYRKIIDVQKCREELSSCITIDDPEQLYITDNFTITHNSITSAIYLLWYASFNFDKNILIAANKNATAMEMIRRIKYAYEELPDWLKPGIVDDGWNKHHIGFDNRSQITATATSEDAGRGQSISLLYLDEFAFVKPNIQKEFWSAILPTLSTGGSCIISSTPNGDNDLFAQIWRAAETQLSADDDIDDMYFHPIFVPWFLPPGRDDAFKASTIAKLGLHVWQQEYECKFLSSDPLLVESDVIGKIENSIYPVLFEKEHFKFWEKVNPNDTYLIGVDPATGTGRDYSVVQVFNFNTMHQVAEYRSNTTNPNDLYKTIMWLISSLDRMNCIVYFSVENNGVGASITALYMNDEKLPQRVELVSQSDGNQLGFNTNVKTKLESCIKLKNMITKNKIKLNSNVLISELKNFVRRKGSYEAQSGSTDDCIAACLIIIRIIEELSTFEDTAFDQLYEYDDISEDGLLTDSSNVAYTEDHNEDNEPPPMIL